MRKLRSVVAALAALACLYVPSAAAEPASTSDPVPPAVVAPTQTEDQTETPTGDEEVAGDTETPDEATDETPAETVDETPAETVDETPKQDADVVEEQPDGTVTLDQTLTYANDEYTVDVTVRGDAVVSDAETPAADAVVSDASGDLAMTVDVLDESQPQWQAVEDYAESKDEAGDVLDVTALDFGFTYQGQTLDVSDCELSATVAPTDALVAAGAAPKAAAEAETGVEVTALNGATEELGTVMVAQSDEDAKTLDVTLDSTAPVLGLAANSALNPHFTVQYYANLEVAKTSPAGPDTEINPQSDASPVLIDTDNGGNNGGGKLPTNGGGTAEQGKPNTTLKTKRLTLKGDGKRSSIATEKKLTLLYEENEYDYFSAPSLHYFNVLEENGNYKLREIWVLKNGRDASSTNRDDWDVYTDLDKLHFTNSESSADSNTIAIKDDMVIRLVAETTDGTYNNAATFYDYDITDSKSASGNGITWDSTNGAHGINSSSNYRGSGAKFAFGNANTGTGLQGEKWNGNTLNQYNRSGNSFQGATFGLVDSLDGNGNIVYSENVDAPKLFNEEGGVQGKTTHSGWWLDFNRSGDTYTLSAVKDTSSTVLDDLEYFNHPVTGATVYNHIWTNNFWPMDKHPGYDGLTGNYMDRGFWVGQGGNELYPPSDDGREHNNMFGMQYSVKFKLTEDYRGPLEYYFFGDDDMWVFLDGKLVCDIGGVHSSIGEYVNLWDYIAKGDAGEHTLTFYYTERGLSGSTCYMQFTLPSVSSVPITHDTGQLKIQKQVVGSAAENLEFSFNVTLTDASGKELIDDYSIMRYATDGSTSAGLIQGGKGSFKLKAKEYVIIDYLPYGTKYTITETGESNGYTVSNQVNGAAVDYDVTAEGEIKEGHNGNVVFTNTFRPKLPDTGGSGVWALSIGGLTLMTFAVVYGVRRRNQATNLLRS